MARIVNPLVLTAELGPALNRAAGATTTMQKIIEQREAKADAAA